MNVNNYYFVENHKEVVFKNGTVDFEPYKKKIKIQDIRNILKESKLEETQRFNDWFSFRNDILELDVVLKSEDNLIDQGLKGADLKESLTDVEIISFKFLDGISIESKEYEFLNRICDNFNLNIYDPRSEQYYSDASLLER